LGVSLSLPISCRTVPSTLIAVFLTRSWGRTDSARHVTECHTAERDYEGLNVQDDVAGSFRHSVKSENARYVIGCRLIHETRVYMWRMTWRALSIRLHRLLAFIIHGLPMD
jgi:hypothetical protein